MTGKIVDLPKQGTRELIVGLLGATAETGTLHAMLAVHIRLEEIERRILAIEERLDAKA